MSAERKLRDMQKRAKEGPIVPASTLYRALQHVARAIARRLAADNAVVKRRGRLDSDEVNRSECKTD